MCDDRATLLPLRSNASLAPASESPSDAPPTSPSLPEYIARNGRNVSIIGLAASYLILAVMSSRSAIPPEATSRAMQMIQQEHWQQEQDQHMRKWQGEMQRFLDAATADPRSFDPDVDGGGSRRPEEPTDQNLKLETQEDIPIDDQKQKPPEENPIRDQMTYSGRNKKKKMFMPTQKEVEEAMRKRPGEKNLVQKLMLRNKRKAFKKEQREAELKMNKGA
mmetsp:Transcript_39378/g.84029  ORF Transcript_39378/g.84029 Transcript_39378/m.84029 type:complete len:220 (+) Transcript_39378:200-859(+)|eukprot:CAMPEP_0172541896 /NCGR_PEP_ID=MMETSP1067-20121228/12621_1 /TAXON_ID=265564 ORGANISM="Thalassiosira punctigera, Strain Tpunct2005C2" /NCGR_SAMPLE_ID=MMETSP1067 /ASSEMBLY_ACC=CAM_ASM_000444 /LENGTH=219 /DNA_ID=CAMNT_0013328023 /DNA_START=198 /DNA_END=857 /DNA_ORIENTATION=-